MFPKTVRKKKQKPLFLFLAPGLRPHPKPQNKTIFLQLGPLRKGGQSDHRAQLQSVWGWRHRAVRCWLGKMGAWAHRRCCLRVPLRGPRGQGAPKPGGLAAPPSAGSDVQAHATVSLLPVGEKKTQPLGAALSGRWPGQASCEAQARGRWGEEGVVAGSQPGDARSHLAGSKIAFFR